MSKADTVQKLTCIEGFCGAGGMSLGLKQAGFDIKLAFDINEDAVKTYNNNLGGHCLQLDASVISGKFLLDKAGINSRLDLFSGGPPCQGFSKQRKGAHLLNDERNKLVLEYSRLVNELNPRAFLFENVEIFGQKRGQDLIREVKEKLFKYNIFTFFICSSDFGVAQKRGRFIMIGIDKSENCDYPKLEKVDNELTIKDVIGNLPPPPDDYSEHCEIPNHIKCKITKLNEERFSYVPPGGGWKDIPHDLRLKCHQNVDTNSGGWPDVYGRLEWDKQCPTITAGFDSFTRGRYGHPSQNRAITLREGAMLQGFPVDYRFYGKRDAIRLQIGNAVPPPVAKAAGTAIIKCLNKQNYEKSNYQNPVEKTNEDQIQLFP
ncbi:MULTISPECIES: DNA cytosine methyltransferase [Escherichia]|uniref:Cytosine-specific methyltransferase n=1 Tax=Escherichia coli TaxID=562 RepID=A0A2Y0PIF4_ECOLX|nr:MULTISPECIES: DNA cytosine methyltransferase [Escherichia]EEJ3565704.1 DNA cytosine methyltransferase [Salmonella enterica subsp. enterica]EFB6652111.1 DNA cytosine methyltransferase [Escherichia coli]EFC1549948.1 DNA cytosine methyltransferase [Escherichia coli]EFC4902547.1 DNA cytosine methyltransferase [Escherichia coli]EFE9630018.1 DNA cytosine methyltransferase [Escherichia coli]